jgi:leucyl/phenylalanyl-tRNA--protein transferase
LKVLSNKIEFPPLEMATKEGLLAIGGDLSPERLILAYRSGIFPWYSRDQPILWWSPDPRFVLFPEKLKISKSLKKELRKNCFSVTWNKAFDQVIKACSEVSRPDQPGTWITQDMIQAYIELHKLGLAISVEVWENDILVGGLYGIDLGNNIFCGESMFSKVSNASKVGFINFIQSTDYHLIDCQVFTDHMARFGAEELPRDEFIKIISGQNNSDNLKNY